MNGLINYNKTVYNLQLLRGNVKINYEQRVAATNYKSSFQSRAASFLLGIVLRVGIWYQTKLVSDLYKGRVGNN